MSVIAIKIECQCGQHYSFDVEPVTDQMPTSIACPSCGADGTGTANELISRSLTEPQSLVSSPRSIKSIARPASVQRRRFPNPRAPLDANATRDLIEAKLDIKRATSAALIVAGLDLLLAILSLCGIRILDTDLWILVDVVIVAGLAYGIHRFSRTCAVLMSIYYLAVCVLAGRNTGIANIVFRAVFLYYFARGAQAMFTYHKLSKRMQ